MRQCDRFQGSSSELQWKITETGFSVETSNISNDTRNSKRAKRTAFEIILRKQDVARKLWQSLHLSPQDLEVVLQLRRR